MISMITWFLAAFFNAVMDAVENENVNESIFKKWNYRFWPKRESWKYAPKIAGYKVDAWHLSKSCMVICFALTLIFFANEWPVQKWQDAVMYLLCAGGIWIFTFWLFYHKLFKIK